MMKVFFNAIMMRFLTDRQSGTIVASIIGLLVVFSGMVWCAAARESDRKSTTLILQSANSNENTYSNGEFISYLRGNVVFLYDDITIRSDDATWWRSEGKVDFRNNVRITQEAQTLTCDHMHFTKKTNRIDAVGKFCYRDTAEKTELTGKRGSYRVDVKDFTLTGDPRMVRFDTLAAETLIISGLQMHYSDSMKTAIVSDSVSITKGKLLSRCGRAVYHTETNRAELRINPRVTFDIHEIVGDSIDLNFGNEALESASIYGSAHGVYIDTGGGGNDSSFTHVWGDSLYMSISDAGGIDSLWVHGKAISKYFTALSADQVNQANGKVMLMSFGKGNDVEKVKIWGNARSTYYIEEEDSQGVNEVSGDSIRVDFRKGKATSINLAGSARGIYFPNNM